MEDISESVSLPRKRDLTFYLVLFFFVGPIWSVVPASWAYVAYSVIHWRVLDYSTTEFSVFTLAVCEVAFSVYYYLLIRKISGPSTITPADVFELQQAFRRVLQSGLIPLPEDGGDEEYNATDRPGSPDAVIEKLKRDDSRAIDFRDRLRTWFKKVPWSRVRRENFRQWLYWSTFNAALPAHGRIPDTHKTLLDEATELLEKRIGCTVPDGYDPSVQVLRLTVDPVNVLPRPLGWYLFVKAINMYIRSVYESRYGLVYGKFRDLEYLLRVPSGYTRATGPDPIVFLHGLGLGIWQYQRVLRHILEELPDTPIMIPIQPPISQNIFHPRFLRPMLRHEKVACLAGAIDRLGWAGPSVHEKYGVTMLSHSNGSYAHAWMLKAFPQIIKRSCFVDPVTFCSWEGDVCYNFVYRPCASGLELIVRYFVGTELGVANLLQRHFDWLSNTLWFEEIPNARDPSRTLFLLGGKDAILDAERVKKYLKSHGVKEGLWYDPNGRHGQALLVGERGISKVIDWIKDFKYKN
ncbi:uncharacterized protein FOMMEDRAFT_125748 [Fomitiporia mediterranea MF3/22]|uniref:uncharacterized protein n=1 Tax=Fomitiporia mediterranea (strain MF3/22) TaxID=694068 RepID=UPI0004407589|nr:uncharacterized protein FOMMEDRAFT_125748 [Fomitiporia mediterranea MF3/22]EJD01104.1 hypothetical protein FOMMEDRAFT_125748 [Fomitiporia mediterranea MF3/22]